jgi:hypothetical protein
MQRWNNKVISSDDVAGSREKRLVCSKCIQDPNKQEWSTLWYVYDRSQCSESQLKMSLLKKFSCLQSCNNLVPKFSHMSNIHIALLKHFQLKTISCLWHKNFRMKAIFIHLTYFYTELLSNLQSFNLLSKYNHQIILSVHKAQGCFHQRSDRLFTQELNL